MLNAIFASANLHDDKLFITTSILRAICVLTFTTLGINERIKLRGFSQQATYTDRATAACVVSATDPHGRNLGFLDPESLRG
jgi:hypothetical protein